jgi:hypothetical protein
VTKGEGSDDGFELATAASMTKRSRIVLRLFVAALVLGPLIALTWPSGYMVSRDIGCARASDARGRAICDSLASSMQWTWLGHAIISPGWRVTWPGLRDVYCRKHLESADVPILERLAQPRLALGGRGDGSHPTGEERRRHGEGRRKQHL